MTSLMAIRLFRLLAIFELFVAFCLVLFLNWHPCCHPSQPRGLDGSQPGAWSPKHLTRRLVLLLLLFLLLLPLLLPRLLLLVRHLACLDAVQPLALPTLLFVHPEGVFLFAWSLLASEQRPTCIHAASSCAYGAIVAWRPHSLRNPM